MTMRTAVMEVLGLVMAVGSLVILGADYWPDHKFEPQTVWVCCGVFFVGGFLMDRAIMTDLLGQVWSRVSSLLPVRRASTTVEKPHEPTP